MLIRDLMNRKVYTCSPETLVVDACKLMNEKGIGSLIVTKEEKVVGIITNRDVLKALVKRIDDLKSLKVEDIMTKKVITISPSNTLEDAVELMRMHNIKRLPVMDGDKLVGLVSVSDIIVVEPKIIESLAHLLSIKVSGYRGG